jgi:hypothetical protein
MIKFYIELLATNNSFIFTNTWTEEGPELAALAHAARGEGRAHFQQII